MSSDLVDRLAELTAHRDRDVLDATLVQALFEMLHPEHLAVHRAVGDAGAERWLTRARMTRADVAPTVDASLADIDELPSIDANPAWRDCLRGQQVLTPDGSPFTALFPLATDGGPIGVLEVRGTRALLPSERAARSRPFCASAATSSRCSTTASATRSRACSTARPSMALSSSLRCRARPLRRRPQHRAWTRRPSGVPRRARRTTWACLTSTTSSASTTPMAT